MRIAKTNAVLQNLRVQKLLGFNIYIWLLKQNICIYIIFLSYLYF